MKTRIQEIQHHPNGMYFYKLQVQRWYWPFWKTIAVTKTMEGAHMLRTLISY